VKNVKISQYFATILQLSFGQPTLYIKTNRNYAFSFFSSDTTINNIITIVYTRHEVG